MHLKKCLSCRANSVESFGRSIFNRGSALFGLYFSRGTPSGHCLEALPRGTASRHCLETLPSTPDDSGIKMAVLTGLSHTTSSSSSLGPTSAPPPPPSRLLQLLMKIWPSAPRDCLEGVPRLK